MNIFRYFLWMSFDVPYTHFRYYPLGFKNWPTGSVICSRWTWLRLMEWMKSWIMHTEFPHALLLISWPIRLKMNWLISGIRIILKIFPKSSLLIPYTRCCGQSLIILWTLSIYIVFTIVHNTIYDSFPVVLCSIYILVRD